MDALAQALTASPELFPHSLDVDRGTVSLIRLTEGAYRSASFLDGRILTPQTLSRTIPLPELTTAAAGLPEACDFIFHIGHVGSTLLSRLMGAHPAVFALREPLILRTLAQSPAAMSNLPTFLKLWSRTFHSQQRAVVKATSFASEIAPTILERGPKGIFLFVPAETYLATILGGPNSRQEARTLATSRFARLQKRSDKPLAQPASEGELIAMSWACEMAALRAVPSSERVLWLDFNHVLADPAASLAQCFHHLGIDATTAQIATILAGPDMRTYSKAQEYDYDAQLRQDVLNQARREHGAEIRRGMRWLERELPALANTHSN
ncbi:MAG TPA: hypothetical protein VGG48_00145 [Rhizomicrobium sp.]|jgi:hypothetical protein